MWSISISWSGVCPDCCVVSVLAPMQPSPKSHTSPLSYNSSYRNTAFTFLLPTHLTRPAYIILLDLLNLNILNEDVVPWFERVGADMLPLRPDFDPRPVYVGFFWTNWHSEYFGPSLLALFLQYSWLIYLSPIAYKFWNKRWSNIENQQDATIKI